MLFVVSNRALTDSVVRSITADGRDAAATILSGEFRGADRNLPGMSQPPKPSYPPRFIDLEATAEVSSIVASHADSPVVVVREELDGLQWPLSIKRATELFQNNPPVSLWMPGSDEDPEVRTGLTVARISDIFRTVLFPFARFFILRPGLLRDVEGSIRKGLFFQDESLWKLTTSILNRGGVLLEDSGILVPRTVSSPLKAACCGATVSDSGGDRIGIGDDVSQAIRHAASTRLTQFGMQDPRRPIVPDIDPLFAGLTHYVDVVATTTDGRSSDYVEPPSGGYHPQEFTSTLVAFYLPQFHRLDVNDEAWGSGFTEWTNVTRTHPFFKGHIQPRLPGVMGFYDLLNPDTLRRQSTIARHYGIAAFCFHYYWFAGRKIMDGPIEIMSTLDDSGMQFCICWANESWSRRWDGSEDKVILPQRHGFEVDKDFIHDVLPFLGNSRYLSVDGRKLLILYRAGLLGSSLPETVRHWRDVAKAEGIGDLLILGTSSFNGEFACDNASGVDGIVEFPPHRAFLNRCRIHESVLLDSKFVGRVDDYDEAIQTLESVRHEAPLVIPAAFPSFDNTPRRGRAGHLFVGSSPRKFKEYLNRCLERAQANRTARGVVFINAWNEWAEGA